MLEAYALSKLTGGELEQIEEHLLLCPKCQRRLRGVDQYVQAIREAARQLREEPLELTRQSRAGPVYLLVAPSAEGKWIARARGRDLDVSAEFTSLQEANEFLLEFFASRFPE